MIVFACATVGGVLRSGPRLWTIEKQAKAQVCVTRSALGCSSSSSSVDSPNSMVL